MKILELLKFTYLYYGFDYSLDGVNLAADYNGNNKVFFQASVVNILLKDTGSSYLLELRKTMNIGLYEKETQVYNNILNKFSAVCNYKVKKVLS